ncbi:hypothetical protein DRJ25_00410 [Candidatus Woesearchaeota archaeon]|nr:MAG: hypothetical protein DRJ25_00410 [Candidatus Woesearchaeota archaeon]
MKKKSVKKITKEKLKKAWEYGITAFCLANNGCYFLSQKELLKCWTKDIYYFSKDKAKKLVVLPRKQGKKIRGSMRKIPKDITKLIKKLRSQKNVGGYNVARRIKRK